MRRILLCIIISIGFFSGLRAQQVPIPDNYLINPVIVSPAFSGKYFPFQAYVTHRSEWTGLSGAPVIGNISIDGKLGKKMGIGGNILLNKAGIYRNFTVNLNYAFHLQVAKDHFLSFGITGAFYQNSVDLSDLVVSDPYDPMILNHDKTTESYFNVGASLLYNWKDFNFCIAFPMMINNKSLYSDTLYDNVLTMNRNWMIYGNYSIFLAKDWKLKIDLLFRQAQHMPWTFDISTAVRYADSYWLGVLYRKNNIIGIQVGLALVKTIVLNYTYEFSGSSMDGKSGGTHEITLGCRIGSPAASKSNSALKINEYDR